MAPKPPFRIIIVGGGIAGLTLAVMLDKVGIDYILLEAHDNIAPQIGASIGLFPNGLRILDQIGCYDKILELPVDRAIYNHTRSGDGKSVRHVYRMPDHLEQRYGYPLLFFDREWLLRLLADEVNEKGKIVTGKRVVKINHLDESVEVVTADGETIPGSLVIGADGIYSAVREEMFRLGDEMRPGYFAAKQEDAVPCSYRCSFGIAVDVPGWESQTTHIVTGRGISRLVASGPNKRIYWFIFERLPEVKYGKDIPRYSKEDDARFAEEHFDLPITEAVTFGDLYAKRVSSALTPLHEIVYKKWFFQRIAILGESAHKPNPLGGQGANSAIESAAEFVNVILERAGMNPDGLDGLTTADIEAALAKWQKAREPRAHLVVNAAHTVQALQAFEKPLVSTLFIKLLAPIMPVESFFARGGPVYVGATSLKNTPIPVRYRVIPYADELPAIPVGKTPQTVSRIAFATGMGLLMWLSFHPKHIPRSIMRSGLKDTSSSGLQLVLPHLEQLISPMLIYTIEGYRVGNQPSLLSLPVLYTTSMQTCGLGLIAPLYAMISAYQSFEMPTGRFIGTNVAGSLLPALVFGTALPLVARFTNVADEATNQPLAPLSKAAPVVFAGIVYGLSRIIGSWEESQNSPVEPAKLDKETPLTPAKVPLFEPYQNKDVPILKNVYVYVFAVQAALHWASLALPLLAHDAKAQSLSASGLLRLMWPTLPTADAVVAAAAIAAHGLYTVWNLRCLGFTTTRGAVKAAIGVAVGQVVVGPGATWAGLWFWREKVIAGLSTWK